MTERIRESWLLISSTCQVATVDKEKEEGKEEEGENIDDGIVVLQLL